MTTWNTRHALIFMALSLLPFASAQAEGLKVVDAFQDAAWIKQRCIDFQRSLAVVKGSAETIECLAKPEADASAKYVMTRRPDAKLDLTIQGIGRERTQLGWTIHETDASAQMSEVRKVLARANAFERDERLAREFALANGAAYSGRVELRPDGVYVDRRTKANLDFEAAFRAFESEGPRHKHYLRAALEILGVLGIGEIQYQMNHSGNVVDHELGANWQTLRGKLTFKHWAMDNNQYWTNMASHPLAGYFYYSFARSNQLSSLESLLMAIGASTVWEFVGEFHERVSINDMVVTPVSGMAIGEVFHQLGDFFMRGDRNVANAILGTVFNPQGRVNQLMDRNRPRNAKSTDRWGFPNDAWHRFDLFGGMLVPLSKNTAAPGAAVQAGIDLELVNIPVYGRPGRGVRILKDTAFTRLSAAIAGDEKGVREFSAFFKAALAGYYAQNVSVGADGKPAGTTFFVGPATAFEASHTPRKVSAKTFEDTIGIVHVLGPSMDLTWRKGTFLVRLTVDVYGDWLAIRSFAVDDALAKDPGLKSRLPDTVAYKQYYHGIGVTVHPQARAYWRRWEIGAEALLTQALSIDTWARVEIPGQTSLRDTRHLARFWIAYTLPNGWMQFRLGVEYRARSGQIEETWASQNEWVGSGRVVFIF